MDANIDRILSLEYNRIKEQVFGRRLNMALNSALRRNDGRIEIRFDFDRKVVDEVKKIPGRLWINDRKVWNLPGNDNTISVLKKVFGKCIDQFLGNSVRI